MKVVSGEDDSYWILLNILTILHYAMMPLEHSRFIKFMMNKLSRIFWD